MNDELTSAERDLIEQLPGPPESAEISATNVWIVEWLPAAEKQTGWMLHVWMKQRREGLSAYFSCQSKKEVIAALAKAIALSQRSALRPILHLEAHGDENGLEGPNGSGDAEALTWDELTSPLQDLNLATRCNLVVVVAACTGFAGIKALSRGPRAPAVALVGPSAPLTPSDLLLGAKEFYRRLLDAKPSLAKMAESASREVGTVSFAWEPFAIIAYEALIENLVRSVRPAKRLSRNNRLRQRLLRETELPVSEVDARLATLSSILPWETLQQTWDEMFMIDVEPSNRERFGLDFRAIVTHIDAHSTEYGVADA